MGLFVFSLRVMRRGYDRRVVLARDVSIDLELIEGLRKDFLTLMKNVPRVKNYKDGDKLREAFRIYSENFKELVFETFLNRDFKYDTDFSEGDRAWFDRQLRKTGWDFYIELRPPIDRPNEYYSEEARFADFEQKKTSWANRVKDKARSFWHDMKEFVEFVQRNRPEAYKVHVRDVEQIEMEGFKVRIIGYDPDYSDEMERFKAGLRLFRQRAAQVFPAMLHHMLPIHLLGYATLDEGGRYQGNHIEVALTGFSDRKNPNIVAHVIAHEMGHHLFKTFLSDADRKFWYEAIREDSTPLDIEKLLSLWPEGAWGHELVQKLKDVDPLLALQIDVIVDGQSHSGGPSFNTREDFEKLLAEGHKMVTVKHPISGYGGKNAEESFCEAIGQVIGYGPNTVPEIVRHWLKLILPGLKTASVRPYVQAAMRMRARCRLDRGPHH